jgi:hypothetical protein
MAPSELKPGVCSCLALRQAARVVTPFDDQHLAASGLRTLDGPTNASRSLRRPAIRRGSATNQKASS